MARTMLAAKLTDLARTAHREVGEGEPERATTRRQLLARAGAAGVAASAAASLRWTPSASAAGSPRIVVVGAGLAGLTAAHRLRQAGHRATVLEASDRVGGRCWTLRGAFADGQIAERGGELIDQGHGATRRLVQELGLGLDNLLAAEANGTEPLYFFDGRPYSYAQATDDLKAVWQQIHSDVSAASYPTLYTTSTPRGRELDAMSITDWIARYVPGGTSSRLGQLLDVAYTIEYGLESSQQSVLNMLYLLGYSGQGQLRMFGPSNEKYHVVGGNDQVPERLAAALEGQISLGSRLVGLRRNPDATWALAVQQGASTRTLTADHVVLALPFTLLRELDLSRTGFSAVKLKAIRELGMGTNSKLQLQFSDRRWRALGGNGDSFADTGYQSTWEVTRGQAGASGILVDYTGGTVGASFGSGSLQGRAKQFLAQLEPVMPGITGAYNGRAALDFWPAHPWTKGSYSCWKVGQYTAFAGAEGERSGTCHFAGEHTSVDFQGYLNGGVETGERAAAAILADLK